MSNTFQPNWATPPGSTIEQLLNRGHLSTADLASRLGVTPHEATSILAGLTKISDQLADNLSNIFGGSRDYWIRRDAQFRNDVAGIPIERRYDPHWLSSIPYAELVRLGWLKDKPTDDERATELFRFFGIMLSSQWRLRYSSVTEGRAFRTSPSLQTNREALAAWLRQGERIGESIECQNWSPIRFRQRLVEARKLTKNKFPTAFIPDLKRICADSGVALVVARTPAGCRASGATQFLSKKKALIILSFRFKTDDQFWFSFFHEAGHLLLHNVNEIYVDEEIDSLAKSEEENQANRFAADFLVSKKHQAEMLRLPRRATDVIRFAMRNGTSPGIVVGQLQKAGTIKYGQLQWLKRRYSDADIEKVSNL